MSGTKLLWGQMALVIAAAMVMVWIATEWTAWRLGFQTQLGSPWFIAGPFAIYPPFNFFIWWYHFDAYAPAIFVEGAWLAATGGFLPIAAAILLSVWRAREARTTDTFGSASWANLSAIKRGQLLEPDGVILGKVKGQYLRHNGAEHVLCFAPTRAGKGVGLVIPTLLTWPGSCVVHDIKGENWHLTSGFRALHGRVLRFDPTDVRSAAYNPLLEIRKGEWEVRDVQNVADVLVDPEGSLERRSHWEKTSHSLLVGAILHVLYAEADKTLAGVANFLSDPKRSLAATMSVMMTTQHLGDAGPHPVIASSARELLNKSENERSGVLSTAMSFLGLYRDPVIAKVTSHCQWTISSLVNGTLPASLYFVVPPSDISRTKPLIRLILNQIGRRLTEDLIAPKRHRLLLMLDEFPALGRLDFFENALAFMAGYGIKSFLIAQSLNQIEKAYGNNNSILDNCHVRVSFATNDERTAKRVSDALGMATELRAMKNYAGHRLSPWLAHVMVSRSETARPLLTPGEVMQLPQSDEIVMVAGTPPIRAKKARYFEDPCLKRRILEPPQDPDDIDPIPDDWSGQPQVSATAATPIAPAAQSTPVTPIERRIVPELDTSKKASPSQTLPLDFGPASDELEDRVRRLQTMQKAQRSIARQVSLDPNDGIEL
jgi:type IV secretion system protein VirD4